MTRSALIVLGVLLIGTWTADTRADPNAERALKTANGLLERGLATEAIPEYRAALEGLESTGSLDEARYGLALSLFRTGAYADALETLDEIVGGAGFAYTADSASLRAHALHRTGRHADAAQAFARFTDEHPNHAGWVSAAALAVECTHRAGDHRAVNRLARRYEERLKGTPAGRRSAFFSAVSHSIRGLHDEAAEGFETLALGAWGDPITEQSTLRLAQSLEQLKRPTDAKQAYERATEAVSDPVRMDAIIGLASMLREDGKAEQALRMLNDLRKGSPGHRPERVSLELGLTELGLGRPDAASALFDEIKKDPALLDDAAYWTSQAESAAGKPALAAQRLERSIEVFPQSPLRPRMMYDLGVALQQAGEGEDARDAFVSFRGAYDRHALVPDALHAEAALLLNAGELEEAADRAQEMLRSHGDHPKAGETAFILAESSYRNGRTDRAAVGFAALLDRLGSMPEADTDLTKRTRYRLGMSLHAEDRDAEAEPHLRAVTAGQDTEARFLPALAALGNAAFDAGRVGGRDRCSRRLPRRHRERRAADRRRARGRHDAGRPRLRPAGAARRRADRVRPALGRGRHARDARPVRVGPVPRRDGPRG
jgi:TolA-binding protein